MEQCGSSTMSAAAKLPDLAQGGVEVLRMGVLPARGN
jgi:hypothetical protein